MKYGKLIIAKSEYPIIKDILGKSGSNFPSLQFSYQRLNKELADAIIKKDDEMPDDVVRINSKFDVQTPTLTITGYQLVLPDKRSPDLKKLSILSLMGSALLGYAAGDEIIWNFNNGEAKIKILNVYQNHINNVEVSKDFS
jgi:regulator of nucleoside diphosphate kinase